MREIDQLSFDNKGQYIGEVLQGKANGEGILNLNDGRIFKGEWKNNSLHGKGTFIRADGSKYLGQWEEGQFNHGTFYSKNGDKYIGEFNKFEKSGLGACFYSDGLIYTGYWSENRFHGRGVLKKSQTQTNGTWVCGEIDPHKDIFQSGFNNAWTIPREFEKKYYTPVFGPDSYACLYLSKELQKEFLTSDLLNSLKQNVFVQISDSIGNSQFNNNSNLNSETQSITSKRMVAFELIKEANAFKEKNEFLTAINLYSKSLKLYPSSQAYWGRGSSKSLKGDYLSAQEDFDNGTKWHNIEKNSRNNSPEVRYQDEEESVKNKKFLVLLLNKWEILENDLDSLDITTKISPEELLDFYGIDRNLIFKLDNQSNF